MATITFTVTVATGTNAFSAGADKFFLNGKVIQKTIKTNHFLS